MRISSVRMAPAARAVTSFSRAIRPRRPIQISPSGRGSFSFSPNAYATTYGSTVGMPSLGFNYSHPVAIGGGRGNGRSQNRGREGYRNGAVFVPRLYGGYPYYYCDDLDDWYDDSCASDPSQAQTQVQAQPQEQVQQQPQVIVVQQPVPMAPPPYDSAAYTPPPAPEPAHDVGEFVLVRRDGRILFASAFSVTGTQLTYVTLEGIRRTISLADLDADATQQMNEARGTTVQIHN